MDNFSNCFAYGEAECGILTEKLCRKGKCKFFKTAEENINEQKQCKEQNIKLGIVDSTGHYDINNSKRTKHYEQIKAKAEVKANANEIN